TYTSTDANVDIESISVDITGGIDLNGETSEDFNAPEVLEIDTENPTVVSCEFIEGDFNEASSGETASLEIVFSEAAIQTTPTLNFVSDDPLVNSLTLSTTQPEWMDETSYIFAFEVVDADEELDEMALQISDITDLNGNAVVLSDVSINSTIDTKAPEVMNTAANTVLINESTADDGTFSIEVNYDSTLDQSAVPTISFPNDDISATLLLDELASDFTTESSYTFVFNVTDADVELADIDILVEGAVDMASNTALASPTADLFSIDTQAPLLISLVPNLTLLSNPNLGVATFSVTATFDSPIDQTNVPVITFPNEDASASVLFNAGMSTFVDDNAYLFVFDVLDDEIELEDIDIMVTAVMDNALNSYVEEINADVFSIDTRAPELDNFTYNVTVISEDEDGTALELNIIFDEPTDEGTLELLASPSLPASLTLNPGTWLSATEYAAVFDITDQNEEVEFSISVTSVTDVFGNSSESIEITQVIDLDNRNPEATATVNTEDLTLTNAGDGFSVTVQFDEEMDTAVIPLLTFPDEDPTASLTLNPSSAWSGDSYVFDFDVDNLEPIPFIDIEISGAEDAYGNPMASTQFADYFSLQLDTFLVVNELEIQDIKIYPNPIDAGDKFIIETEQVSQYELVLYDINGRQIPANWNQTGDATIEVSTLGLASGKYFIRLLGEYTNTVLRIEVLN
ncbi:MAG: T9SS type A sorting domain-containing protein, partial [Flavobacteriales bacterium]